MDEQMHASQASEDGLRWLPDIIELIITYTQIFWK
jgi:hypothetical protein